MLRNKWSILPVRRTLWLAVGILVSGIIAGVISLPQAVRAFEEIDTWPCHWGYSSGWLDLDYTWYGNLVTPSNTAQSNIKTAYSYSVSDWSSTPTVVNFRFVPQTNKIWLDSFYQVGGASGYVNPTCTGVFYTFADAYVNEVGADVHSPTTVIRSVAGHELGHVIGIGHGTKSPALLGVNPNPSVYYVPQQDDIDAVNSYY